MSYNKPNCIILIGPPACGKGTQAKILEENIEKSISISTGELIRKKGDLSGEYVNDEIIKQLLLKEISKYPTDTTFILDGAVRTLNQIKIAQELFEIQYVISFDFISYEELKKRIISRGREEDPLIRVNDYLKKSSIVREYFSIYYTNLFISIHALDSVEEISRRIKEEMEKN